MLAQSRALWLLQYLQVKSVWRRMIRQAKTFKGAMLTMIVLAMFALWMLPMFLGEGPETEFLEGSLVHVFTLIVAAVTLMQLVLPSGRAGLTFTPSEVQFLLPAPLSRRQLLLYKLIRALGGSFFIALFGSIWAVRHGSTWPKLFIAILLATVFVQLVGITATLLAASIGERFLTRSRVWLLGGVLAIVAAIAAPMLIRAAGSGFDPETIDFTKLDEGIFESPAYRHGLAPFRVFGMLATASRLVPDALGWAAVAIAMDIALILLIVRLDADFREAAIARGERAYEKLQRFRRGRGAVAQSSKRRWFRVPPLPRMLGAGVILRRQAIAASRSSVILVVLAIVAGAGLIVSFSIGDREEVNPVFFAMGGMALIGFYMTMLSGAMLRIDFRGELETMERLKTLPLAPTAIAVGEVLPPTIFVTLCQIVFGVFAGALSAQWFPILGVAALFFPLNFVVFSIENIFFLMFPAQAYVAPGDFQAFGVVMLQMIAKAIIVLMIAGCAGGIGFLLYSLGVPVVAAATVVWCVLTAFAAWGITVVAWAFLRFDPSMDRAA